jgi:hypothetical protein
MKYVRVQMLLNFGHDYRCHQGVCHGQRNINIEISGKDINKGNNELISLFSFVDISNGKEFT